MDLEKWRQKQSAEFNKRRRGFPMTYEELADHLSIKGVGRRSTAYRLCKRDGDMQLKLAKRIIKRCPGVTLNDIGDTTPVQ